MSLTTTSIEINNKIFKRPTEVERKCNNIPIFFSSIQVDWLHQHSNILSMLHPFSTKQNTKVSTLTWAFNILTFNNENAGKYRERLDARICLSDLLLKRIRYILKFKTIFFPYWDSYTVLLIVRYEPFSY